ncbi:GATA transcription factor 1-like [Silene latifolia]|uniref:GATA transcription factor 1-like n=1 Tax=Silene latifolia TaxID=37657 RepID=UPI003D7707B3
MDSLFDMPSDFSDNENDVILSSYHHHHQHRNHNRRRAFSLLPCPSSAFPEIVEEEELEWISNKDAFPMVESFVDIIPNHPSISSAATRSNDNGSHLSPVSVLENSSTSCSNNNLNLIGSANGKCVDKSLRGFFKVPGKARTNRLRKRRGEMSGELFHCWEKVKVGPKRVGIGRKCLHCGSEKTPQWRAGPSGPKTLCNACGVRYKSGRLVPEYRPASSPTFSSELHSNSHRKIVEMRKQKMTGGEACEF